MKNGVRRVPSERLIEAQPGAVGVGVARSSPALGNGRTSIQISARVETRNGVDVDIVLQQGSRRRRVEKGRRAAGGRHAPGQGGPKRAVSRRNTLWVEPRPAR